MSLNYQKRRFESLRKHYEEVEESLMDLIVNKGILIDQITLRHSFEEEDNIVTYNTTILHNDQVLVVTTEN